MAIIQEYDDQPDKQLSSPSKPKPKPKPEPEPDPKPQTQTPNPFTFWFYFTLLVSLTTLLFTSLSSLTSPDPKAWFFTLPTQLRTHYSLGRTLKVQLTPNEPQLELFTYSKGSKGGSTETVLIIHGLGCSSFSFRGVVDELASKGFFAVAVDLPGSGFSDKAVEREVERVVGGDGILGRVVGVYEEIREKGVFWRFDSLIENGHLPVEDVKKAKVRVKVWEPVELGGGEVGRVVGQVVDALGVGPVHLVLHDSALGMVGNWVGENSGLVRSVTLLDASPRVGMALPLWAVEVPVVREVVLGVDYVFGRVIGSCCSRGGVGVEAHRVLLKGRGGRGAIVGMASKLNQSFDLAEWVSVDGVKGMPMQVLWSGSWSEEWSEEGRRVAQVVSQARFIKHSGGRWPQDDTSTEVAEIIVSFILSLPKTDRKADDEPLPEHIQKMLDETKAGSCQHDHGSHSHHDGHSHGHGAHSGYMDAYGLGNGHGWGM